MKTFTQYIEESLAKSVLINKNAETALNPEQMKSYATSGKYVSTKFADKYENIIGTLTFNSPSKRHIEYAIFELDDADKKEFGSDGVYGISSNSMLHQGRSIVKIKGAKVYFIDHDKYADDNIVEFNDPEKLKAINIINKKYLSKF